MGIVGIMKWYIRKQVQLASPIIKTFKDLADEYGPMVKSFTGNQLASIKVSMQACMYLCTFIIKGTHNPRVPKGRILKGFIFQERKEKKGFILTTIKGIKW